MSHHPLNRSVAWSRRGLVALLSVLVLVLAACGGADPTPTPPPPTPTEVPLIEDAETEEEAGEEDADAAEAEATATPAPEEEGAEDADAEATATPAPEEEDAEDADAEATATPEPEEEGTEDVDADATATPEPEEEGAEDSASAQDDAFLASITLPDGTECLHAGRGATLAFDDARVNYTCSEEAEGTVLLGDMSTSLDLLTVQVGEVVDGDDGFELASSEELEMRMAEVTLADGTVCLNAGQGATQAFDGDRVNFTCDGDAEDGELVLIGDMTVDMDVLTATQALVVDGDDGAEVAERTEVIVVSVVGAGAE